MKSWWFLARLSVLVILFQGCEEAHHSRSSARPTGNPRAVMALPSTSSSDDRWGARVDHVFDGDSLVVVRHGDGRRIELRIEGIDAPERGQPFARQSRAELRRLLLAGEISVESRERDRYGRTVAVITVDGSDVGREMISRGLAWHYDRFASEQDPSRRRSYARAEESARRARAGLWRDAEPVPPWEWRQNRR